VHDALVAGFGGVILYGAIGVWLLAAASFLVFAHWKTPACAKDCGTQPAE
jgi:hypothetical protein